MLARWGRLLVGFALFNLLLSPLWPAPVGAQTPAPTQVAPPAEDEWVEEMLAGMTTADKVGQLFLVTFYGDSTDAQSAIARLVQLHRVGGVILSPENENFTSDPSTSEQVLSVTTAHNDDNRTATALNRWDRGEVSTQRQADKCHSK